MRRRRLLWQLFPSYLLITVIAMSAVAWYAASSMGGFQRQQRAADLEALGRVVEKEIATPLAHRDDATLQRSVRSLGQQARVRLTIILPDGDVVADSQAAPATMENHKDRPEIITAMHGRRGVTVRRSYTLREDMMYVAIPIRTHGKIVGVMRCALPITSLMGELHREYLKIGLGALAIAILAAAISLYVSRRISLMIEEMRLGAERFADGDLNYRLALPNSREIGALAKTMNSMAQQLEERITTITQQRNQQEAVLSSMVEGVLVVDADERLIVMNQAAAQLIGIHPEEAQGKTIQEIIRNSDLQRLIAKALASAEPVEGDITLYNAGEHFLQAHGTAVRDVNGKRIGALAVLNDITRLRRLENIRRDFVANVSHELRTPVTAIQGFVETLRDGAIDDPEDARRFLEIISKQTSRLNAIIEDLLNLSRIEQDADKGGVVRVEKRLAEILRSAIGICEDRANEKHMAIALDAPDILTARVNAQLLEQAVTNLIDNAIKYSDDGKQVRVTAARAGGQVTISVIDQGVGIDKDHLPRLFERFYRVDKARSRKIGGTGLGLAIVKHIALAHGGSVSVDSTPGVGSTFRIHLP